MSLEGKVSPETEAILAWLQETERQFAGLTVQPIVSFHRLPRKVFDELLAVAGSGPTKYFPPDDGAGFVAGRLHLCDTAIFRSADRVDAELNGEDVAKAVKRMEKRLAELRELAR